MPSLFWGFILTKWYVNYGATVLNTAIASGFILTKWYVNTYEKKKRGLGQRVLY
ncbi:hypothetical protein LWE87_13015 [Clostridioides difficile]|nr:hypothetical protein [Clostridioides difficile]MCE0607670.1 hypothetical protein [Clostridioides difficile]MCE0618223.1 hypothetical protein [Clostridioides difficile]MCE0665730.1 hypothetical protein [Clostridioides difficile]HAT4370900.1 hypothetical protein [Clostridioides difficile]